MTVLTTLTGLVAVGDVIFMAMIAVAIPPLVLGAALTLVGLALLRRRPRAGIAVLGLTSLALGLTAIDFLGTHLTHPGSTVDFLHAALGIAGSQFPDTVVVEAGRTVHLDNQDLSRHTFTVPDTDLDVDLPATSAARATVDLPAGTYTVICDIPGHEHMTSQLTVR